MGKYTPGYVDVPGKGRRYRDADGNFFHNHLGKPLTQLGNLFGNPGFGRTTQHHVIGEDGSIGGRVKPKAQTPAAPAEPVVKPKPTPTPTPTPTPAPTPTAPVEPSSGGSGGPEVRQNEKGIVQKGMTLGGVNNFLGGLKIRSLGDMNELYSDTGRNTDLEGFALSDVDVEQGYDVSDGAYPGKRTAFNQTSTTPQTTSKPDSPQDGASAEPTVADQVRAVRIARGARQQEFAERPGNSKSSEPKNSGTNWGARTMADNSDMRTRIGSAFLSDDYDNSLQALRAAETEAGVFKQGGKVFYNQGGELVEAKDNGKDFYRSAMRGINPMEFADKPEETPTPTTVTEEQARAVGAAFAQDYIDRVKGAKVQPTRGTAPGTRLFEAARPGL